MVIKENLGKIFRGPPSDSGASSGITDAFFICLIVLSLFSFVNRKNDSNILDFSIALSFFLVCVLTLWIIHKILNQKIASKLVKITCIFGLITNLLFAFGIGLAKIIPKFRDVTWNVDSRLFLSQTYSYIKFGNSNNSNSYAGFDIDYHATPSYLAAVGYNYFKINPNITLFIAIPLITYTSLYICSDSFLKAAGFSKEITGLGALVVASTPYVTTYYQGPKLLNPLITSELMLNAQLALAVFCAVVYIRIRNIPWKNLYTFLGLISLIGIKPQYIPFAALSLCIIEIVRSNKWDLKSILKTCLPMLASLTLALLFMFLYSRSDVNPEYIVELVPINWSEYLRANTLVFLIALAIPLTSRFRGKRFLSRDEKSLLIITGTYLVSRLMLDLTDFQISEITLSNLKSFRPIGPVGDSDFNQGLLLLFITLVILVTSSFLKITGKSKLRSFCILLIILFTLRILFAVPSVANPSAKGYEAVDLWELRGLLIQAEQKVHDPRFLVNDFVDPAENYRRNGSSMYWSSLGVGNFYLSDVNTFHYLAPDFAERLELTKKFFDSPISMFQRDFAELNKIDFIIINKRCTPNWYLEVTPIYQNGKFALIDTKSFGNDNSWAIEIQPTKTQLRHFGSSPCL